MCVDWREQNQMNTLPTGTSGSGSHSFILEGEPKGSIFFTTAPNQARHDKHKLRPSQAPPLSVCICA